MAKQLTTAREGTAFGIGLALGLIVAGLLTLSVSEIAFRSGYESGQIDAIQGNIKYEQVYVPTWKEKDDK